MFKGLLKYNDLAYHVYTTSDKTLLDVGLASYNISALEKYLNDESIKDGMKQKELFDILTLEKLLGENTGSYYWKFDEKTGQYTKEDINISLKTLAEDHEKIEKASTVGAGQQDNHAIIQEVQKSLTGCIYFEIAGKGTELIEIRLYFQSKSKRDNSRVIATKGEPIISSVPKTPTGRRYHFGATQYNKAVVGVGNEKDSTNVGHYKIQERGKFKIDDNKDVSAQVASKLRLSYNESLGYFESGTQVILARLLQNVDPAPISEIDLSSIDSIEDEDLYNPDSPYNMSQFSTGVALPLSIHDANPHTFGPNIINSQTNKKEKIRVVNRVARGFKANDVVLCLLIGSEWIIIDFGEQTLEPPGVKLGKWSFTKMMVNTDGFLQDKEGKEIAAEEAYSIRMKSKFYTDLNTMFNDDVLSEINDVSLLARLNAAPTQLLADVKPEEAVMPDMTDILFKPTDKYIQASSFDMVGANMGGNNTHGNIIGRTNRVMSNNPANLAPVDTIQEIGAWWGPLFPDGFASSKTLSIKGTSKNVSYNGISSFFGGSDVLNLSTGDDKSTTGGMFDDRLDFNFYQLPADIGINASPEGENGSPIESLSLLTEYEFRDNLAQAYNDYRFSVERFSWISTDDGPNTSFYDLEPVTKTKLQLIPLAWGMPSGEAVAVVSGIDVGDEDKLWGAMFERESEYLTYTFSDGIPWDLQVDKPPRSEPWGVVYAFRDNDPRGSSYDGANLLGITAGKNTVRIGGGASLQFDASYSYGLPKWTSVTGGQVTPPTILPIGGGLAFGGGTNAIKTWGFPQWGSNSTALSQVWGGSTLRVKVYDHWPEEDTIYDVRYFQPLHFCAGKIATGATTIIADSGVVVGDETLENWNPAESVLGGIRYERSVDETAYPEDFRVPTYGDPVGELDNVTVPVGQIINQKGVGGSSDIESTLAQLRNEEEWRVNTICRGMMVDENFGFRYMKRTIGINPDDYSVLEGGEGFTEGMIFDTELPNDIIIEIGQTDGSLTDGSIIVKSQGEGLLPSRFSSSNVDDDENVTTGMVVNIGTAKVMFHTGIVYDKLSETLYPKKQGSVGCLPKSDGDAGVIYGSKSTTIGISKPNNTNLYDIFFFYANDVGHVDMFAQAQTAGFIQYVDFDIGAA